MVKKLSLKTIIFAVIAIAMFVFGIVALASFVNIKPAKINSEKITKSVSAEEYEARIGETYYATLKEAFDTIVDEGEYTIHCLKDIVIDETIQTCPENESNSTTGAKSYKINLLCDGKDVSITRSIDTPMFVLGDWPSWVTFNIGSSVNNEYQFIFDGNNMTSSIFSSKGGTLVIYKGEFYGKLDGLATNASTGGGLLSSSTSEGAIAKIYGGTFQNFMTTSIGGVIGGYDYSDDMEVELYGELLQTTKQIWEEP